MSQSGPSASLGQKNLSTIHAVAQSLAIGPLFSTALLLRADLPVGRLRDDSSSRPRSARSRSSSST